FTRIDIVHVGEGEAIDVEAVRRAIELSATKYCAVGATLSSGMTEIHHAYLVRDRDGEERMAEVIVTDRSRRRMRSGPDSPARRRWRSRRSHRSRTSPRRSLTMATRC